MTEMCGRPAGDPAVPQKLLQPFPAQLMQAFPVSTRVNTPKNDTPDLIEQVPA